MSKPVFEIAIALVHRDGRWLIARRLDDAHLGGLWEFPGGKREANESALQAAVRELREECGIEAAAEKELPDLRYEYPERIVHITPVICQWKNGEPRPLGNEECRWVTLRELRRLEMPAANTEVLRELQMFA